MRGYAVVDIETTGFSFNHGHRIIEIGVVELSPAGEIESSWETLVNPQRHVSATEVHKITAADVCGAPIFSDIADRLLSSLDGRILVAHNARFDSGFIHHELRRCGRGPAQDLPVIDTVRLAKKYLNLPSVKLGACCEYLGITNEQAHAAVADAIATAKLFQYLLKNTPAFDHMISALCAQVTDLTGVRSTPGLSSPQQPVLLSRKLVAEARAAARDGGWFAGLVRDRAPVASVAFEEYFKLLDLVLLDQQLSLTEQTQLVSFANNNRVGRDGLRELHESYVSQLIEQAWADGVITEQERNIVLTVASALGVSEAATEAALASNRSSLSAAARSQSQGSAAGRPVSEQVGPLQGILLHAGDRVTVTGEKKFSRADWTAYLAAHGVELAGIAKKTRVLIAGDPDSQSLKAKKARVYGIPIIAEEVARDIIRFAD
ncbi:exonuclease domain-containing protein [Canibacter zhoujuaniae]|uniref:exonuclease domain-containing protein n=1 Tax=Canibacter zhoujuaniae TaxID=2708343 RepID=UPI00142181D9|nr:exonuclease domain-containing protein [Canibacter zhoujuaniae]